MAAYTIIADIGNAITERLKEKMVPELIANGDAIGLCSPAEKENSVLGVYLYDIKESSTVRINGLCMEGLKRQVFPPVYLELFYMVTAYAIGDHKFRSLEEQRILGRVIQLFKDHSSLNLETLTFDGAQDGGEVKLELLSLNAEDKMKLWNYPNIPYRLSLFYRVSPVPMDSRRSREVTRVREIEMTVKEHTEQG